MLPASPTCLNMLLHVLRLAFESSPPTECAVRWSANAPCASACHVNDAEWLERTPGAAACQADPGSNSPSGCSQRGCCTPPGMNNHTSCFQATLDCVACLHLFSDSSRIIPKGLGLDPSAFLLETSSGSEHHPNIYIVASHIGW